LTGTGSIALGAESTATLKQCYDWAVAQNEDLKISREGILQLASQRRSTRALALPDIKWKWSNFRQDTTGIRPTSSGSDQTNSQKSRTTSSFNATQPLYSGFAEFSAMSSLLSEKEREELMLKRALQELYADVARVYYNVLQAETDLSNVRTNLRLTRERISELKDRVRLGKSRHSEMLSAESQAENLSAEETRNQGTIVRGREQLSFLTGHDMSSVPLADQINLAPSAVSVEDALARSDNRSDVQALRADADAKRKAVRVAHAAFHPSADVEGNYYTQRPSGLLHEVDWDLLFSVEVPLFQGGSAFAGTSEAKSRYRESELNLSRLRRSIRTDVKSAFNLFQTSVSETKSLAAAYQKAKESYELQVREYRLGLVNNLEVLQAQNVMQDVKHDWDHTALETKVNYVNYLLSMGDIQ
jgi:outer membrane protein